MAGLEKHLTGSTFLVGHQLTLADVSLACDVDWLYAKVGCWHVSISGPQRSMEATMQPNKG